MYKPFDKQANKQKQIYPNSKLSEISGGGGGTVPPAFYTVYDEPYDTSEKPGDNLEKIITWEPK